MIESQWFSMLGTPLTISFGVLLVVVTAVFSMVTLRRCDFSKGMCLLESLRIFLVILVALTLNQPEWLQQFTPEENPVLAVLWDDSASMDTRDVLDSSDIEFKAIRRRDRVKSLLDDEIWASVVDEIRIVKQPFSSGLANPRQGSDLNSALGSVLEKHPNLRGVVMLTDGRWNVGDVPTNAATRLRMAGVPAYCVGVGSKSALPDLEVTALDAPTFGVVNKPIRIPFTISSTLAQAESLQVTLAFSSGEDISKDIQVPANGRVEDLLVWTPKKIGEYTITLTIPSTKGESVSENNTMTVPISIRRESLKVLLVESFPRWEYRYLRNALMRDPGVDVSCLLFHPQLSKTGGGKGYVSQFPKEMDQLSKYDVIVLGDVGVGKDQLTSEDCRRIKGLVENQACGLILMPGFRGKQFSLTATELSPLFPVVLDESQPRGWGSQLPDQFQLTEAGQQSLLTKLSDTPESNASVWRSLPGFQWHAPVLRAKAGSQVLAVLASGSGAMARTPLLVTKTFGSGKILFMGTDGAWRWRKGVEDRYHYRFWGQVIRWMAYQRNMARGENMRLYYSPEHPKVGQKVTLNTNVMGVGGEPLRQGDVNVQIVSPTGQSQRLQLSPPDSEAEWGLFTNSFTAEESGDHQVIVTCRENGSTLESVINVQGNPRERIGQPVNVQTLQEIANLTKGRMVDSDEIAKVLSDIATLPEPEARLRRIRLWANPIWCGFLIFLLTLFWSGRKLIGKTCDRQIRKYH